jgi:predicted Zn-dependent protease
MKKLFLVLMVQCFMAMVAQAQPGRDETLAASYLENGEYDKAAELYQSLWQKSNYDVNYYAPLYKCLIALKKYDNLEKIVKKEIKKNEGDQRFIVDLGYVYLQIPDEAKAKDQFEKAIKDVRPYEPAIRTLANTFQGYGLYDYVISAYEKGNKIFHNDYYFSLEIANASLAQGDVVNAARYFIANFENRPENDQLIKNTIQTSHDEMKLLAELEKQLYAKVQKNPDADEYIDFLTWIYIQNKDFEGAFIQMKALDKRKGENGYRVLNIAHMAQAEGDYDDAIAAFEYVVGKGRDNPLYFQARTELLDCRKEKISKSINYTRDDLLALKGDYLSFINDNERGFRTAQSMKELADLEGFYLHQPDSAIALANEIIHINGITNELRNTTKLSLGDFYLADGDVWDATLLYSQVDKDEKDSPLGEEARFKNAKLAYYRGDFDWAQTQLEVLKASTYELISNDAIALSVFIIDNLGMDTVALPMQMYARADLLQFQNKDDEAVMVLDSITKLFPGHALTDNIEYTKAQIFVKHKEFDKAVPLLEDIIKNYKDGLRGDDATFLLAQINEQQFHNKQKAMELYKSIILDFNNSLLVIEARKRYRMLRGDAITE